MCPAIYFMNILLSLKSELILKEESRINDSTVWKTIITK